MLRLLRIEIFISRSPKNIMPSNSIETLEIIESHSS